MTQATITESPEDSLRSAAERMWRQQTGSLLIIEAGRLIAIVTERDVLRAVALGADPDRSSVDEAVVAGDEVLGVVSMRDVTGVFAALASGRVDVEHEFDLLVRERRLARIEHGDLD
jgi:CBS domain-containing protein